MMAVIRVQSARNFRHIRGAAFGVGLFLRVAWGFIVALNIFSKTTKMEPAHQAISAYLFVMNILAVSTATVVAAVETWQHNWAWWSQVSFEVGWLTMFVVFELVGAITFTVIEPTFKCDYGFVNVFKIPENSTDPSGDLRRRVTSSEELVKQTCDLYNLLTVAFVWVIVALSLLYTLWFALLAKIASWRSPDVWHSRVAKFDWSVTSADNVDPRSLERPGNPQMEKFSEKSTPIDPYFEPNFVNPFSNAPVDDFAPQFAIVSPPLPRGEAFDRHQLMKYYAREPQSPASPMAPTGSTQRAGPGTFSSCGSTFEDFDARQLAAMKLEGKASGRTGTERKIPRLSVQIPQPVSCVPIGSSASPKSQLYQSTASEEHMPFQGSFSSEGGHVTAATALTQPYPMPEPSSVPIPTIPPLHMSFLNQGFSPIYRSPLDEAENLALQSVLAPHRYPDIVRSPNRKSTKIVPDSIPHIYSQGEPRSSRSAAPSGAVLPIHSGDLPNWRPRPISRVPVPRYSALPPTDVRTPIAPEAQIRRTQTEGHSPKMHGPRPLSGPAHNRSSSNQTWPPYSRPSRHTPTGSTSSMSSNSPSTGPRGPWSPPGLSSHPNSQHRPKSAFEARMPLRGWHYPSSSTSSVPSIPQDSSLPSSKDIRHPAPVAFKTSRTITRTEGRASGTPTSSERHLSSYESTKPTWQELDEQLHSKYGMDDKRRSRGKLRKPNPSVFKDTL